MLAEQDFVCSRWDAVNIWKIKAHVCVCAYILEIFDVLYSGLIELI